MKKLCQQQFKYWWPQRVYRFLVSGNGSLSPFGWPSHFCSLSLVCVCVDYIYLSYCRWHEDVSRSTQTWYNAGYWEGNLWKQYASLVSCVEIFQMNAGTILSHTNNLLQLWLLVTKCFLYYFPIHQLFLTNKINSATYFICSSNNSELLFGCQFLTGLQNDCYFVEQIHAFYLTLPFALSGWYFAANFLYVFAISPFSAVLATPRTANLNLMRE